MSTFASAQSRHAKQVEQIDAVQQEREAAVAVLQRKWHISGFSPTLTNARVTTRGRESSTGTRLCTRMEYWHMGRHRNDHGCAEPSVLAFFSALLLRAAYKQSWKPATRWRVRGSHE